jgi:hypothetical protein
VTAWHPAQRALGYQGARRRCRCGRTRRFVEHRPKSVATLLGLVRIRRAYYRCAAWGASALPCDQQVGLGDGPESVGLAKAAALLGHQESSETASWTLYELTGQGLSESTIERLIERVGGVAAAQEERRPPCPRAAWAGLCLVVDMPPRDSVA